MAELCLLHRATVLSFSDEVTHVSNLIEKKKSKNRISLEKIDDLYKHYILFINKIYFREVTAQEQGIEMYDMMQKIMRIPNDVKDLDKEIGELNHFASKEEAHNLTRLATIFLIPTLIASLLGMNVIPGFKDLPKYLIFEGEIVWQFWTSILFIVIFTFFAVRYNIIMKTYRLIRFDFLYTIRKYFRK
jgi:Mg2+ and Co2+ transporter CorA